MNIFNPIYPKKYDFNIKKYKNLRHFTFFFHTKFSKSNVYFMLTTHFNVDAKFSSDIFYLYAYFIKFAVVKVDSHPQIITNILKFF